MKFATTAVLASGLALLPSVAAAASDEPPSQTELVYASDPEGVVTALRKLGYRAELTEKEGVDPLILSAATGYDFQINFNECTAGKACRSLGFLIVFGDDGKNTLDLANTWNRNKRFSQMAVNENGTLAFSYDVTTVGGLTPANFADVVDWWQSMLGQLRIYFTANAAK